MKKLLLLPWVLFISVTSFSQVSIFPWNEDLESEVQCGTGCTSVCNLAGDMTNDPSATRDWLSDRGGTGSGGTGPTVDHTLGTTLGYYVYSELSGCGGQTWMLSSPFFDFSSITSPKLSFWYHMAGDPLDMGDVITEVHIGQNGVYTQLDTISGVQQASQTDPWLEKLLCLSAYGSTDSVQFRLRYINSNTFGGDAALDDFSVFAAVPNDVAVTSIDGPQDGCGLSATETVTITVENLGAASQTNIPIQYRTNGGTTLSAGILAGPLAACGGTATHTFTANLSTAQTYNFEVWTNLVGDAVPSNDTATAAITNITLVSTFPYSESFEGGAAGWDDDGNSSSWAVGAPAGTVINSASDGTQAWTTNLAGGYNQPEQSWVRSPCFDLTAITDPEVIVDVWWDSEFSWDGSNIQSSIDGGQNWTNVGSTTSGGSNWYNDNSVNGLNNNGFATPDDGWSGTGGTGSGGWVTASHDLTGLGSQSSVLLRVTFGSDGGGAVGNGFAFDKFTVRQKPLNDAGVASIDGPSVVCGASSTDTVTITISNSGANTILNIPISYSVNGGSFTSAGISTDSIQAGNSGTYSFPVTFGAVGNNTLSVTTVYPGDPDNSNDTASGTVLANQLVSTYPYSEGFEGGNGGWNDFGSASSWALGTPANPTIVGAAGGTQAWITNLTGQYNQPEQSWVQSPCFDFTSLTNPEALVDVWWESEFSWDGANVQSSIDGGQSWANVGSTTSGGTNWYNDATINGFTANGFVPTAHGWSGATATGSGGWVNAKHDLTGLGGQSSVLLRVTFASDGGGGDDGFAFDNFMIREKPLNDLAISEILAPGDGCGLGNESVEVVVGNFGANAQSTFSVSFQVNGGSIITQNFTSTTVAALDTIHLPLDSLMDLSTPGPNTVLVWTTLAGDQDTSNDTLSTTITHETNTIATFPHLEDFETFTTTTNATGAANGWVLDPTNTTALFRWNPDVGGTPSGSTGPSVDHTLGTASGRYVHTEGSSGGTGAVATLTSPCIDLNPLTNPVMEYWYHMYGANMGTLDVEVNSGGVWTVVQSITGQQQTINGDPWLSSFINLGAYSGQSIKVRFTGTRGNGFNSDMAVDDIRLFDAPLNDAGVIALDAPATVISAGTQNVEVSVENFGFDTLVSATVNWEANGSAQTPFSWTGSLAPGNTSTNNNIGSFNFPAGLTQLTFYTSSPNGTTDDDTSNDTLETFVCTPLSGTYTVGATGDFDDMSEALAILQTCGVNGPVTINVQTGAGPFSGQLIFTAITGASSTNTVTFNGAGETITHTALFSDKRIIGFDGAQYITLDSFKITSGSPTYGYGIHLKNSSDNITIQNCWIDLANITSTSSTNSGGIVASNSNTSTTTDGDNTNFSVFQNNLISGGSGGSPYQAIYLNGQGTGADCKGNQILNNEMVDFYRYGIYFDEVDSATVSGNEMHRPSRTTGTTTQMITTQGKTERCLIEKNEMHNSNGGQLTSTSTFYGMYSTSNDADPGDENVWVNNILYDINHNGTVYAIYNFSSNGQWYYHNTVSLDNTTATGGTTRGFYQTTTASNLDFRNNIISVTRGGTGVKHGIYLNSTGTAINSDFNDIYVNSAGSGTQSVGRYGTTSYATMANWQTANTNAYDQASVSVDPFYVNVASGNLIPNQTSANNIGTNLGIADDFSGAARGVTPDPGALEFDVATNDAGVTELVAPISGAAFPGCGLSASESITVAVKNFGTTTITSIPVSYVINGGTPVTQTFTTSILFNDTVHLTFSTPANLSTSLNYTLDFYTSLTGDGDNSNDTLNDGLNMGQTAPYIEDFETFGAFFSSTYANDWSTFNSNGNTSNPRWEAEDANGANENSGGTGPAFDNTFFGSAGGHYMYMETSSPAGLGDTAYLVTPCIDMSAILNPYMEFHYHMFGAAMGNLYTEVYSNGSWIRVDSIIGQQQPVQTDPWGSKIINLCDFTGEIIRVRFCGAAGSTFTSDMAIDDFSIYDQPPFNDAAITDFTTTPDGGYCTTPLSQVVAQSFGATVANIGTEDNTNVTLDLNVGTLSETANLGTMLACDDDSTHSFSGTFTATATGSYPVVLTVGITELDAVSSNDTALAEFVVTDTVYSRDDSTFTNGIGSTTGILEIGQLFDFNAPDTLTSVSFFLQAPVIGDSVRVFVYNYNNGPTTKVDSSGSILITGPGWYTEHFCDLILPAGQYFVAVEQLVGINNMTLGYTLDKFTDSTAYFGTGGGTWSTLESAGFPSALLLRANVGHTLQLAIIGTDSICAGDMSTITANSGFAGYSWSTGSTTAAITTGTAGTYTVTVTAGNGCTQTGTFTVVVNSLPAPNITGSTNVSCNGGNDGSATATGTNGNTPYSYLWSNGTATATASGLAAGTYTVTVTDDNGCVDTTSVTISEPTVLSASSVVDNNASCNGVADGGATASASGGTPTYTYAWSNGATTASITGVVAGTYTATVTDANGCTATTSVTITEPVTLVAAGTIIDQVSCNGFSDGVATASATGGTMAYTYAWSNSATTATITGVIAGTYSVTITDANGCTDSASVTIIEPTTMVSSAVVDNNVSCFGFSDGGATASGTGGTSPYAYAWSNGATTASITGAAAGAYSVTITDANGCTDSSSVVITEPTFISVSAIADSNASCNGFTNGGATGSASGATPPYTYLWSNGATTAVITGLAAGTYTMTATDANGCFQSSGAVTITEPTLLTTAIDSIHNVTCGGADGAARVVASGGTSPYTYNWPSGGTNALDTGLFAGTYTVTVTDGNGCTDTVSGTITQPSSLAISIASIQDVSCNGLSDGSATAAAAGGTGAYTYAWSSGSTTASETGLAAGTYTVSVSDANGCLVVDFAVIGEPAVLVVATAVDNNVSCNGVLDGGATASATGGTTPYTYAWSNAATTASITAVGAGTYTVTITDANGCTDFSSVTISEPTVLVASATVDNNVSCNGLSDGGATASATGGTSPYTYAWSNAATTASITGVAAGTYTVTVTDANGCTDNSSVTITEPAVLVSSAVVDNNVSCNGLSDGGATASATGGTTPYTYVWSNAATTASITGVVAGTYSVTVTDANGCSDNSSVTITEPPVLVSAAVVDNNVSCNGFTDGGATASATGGSGTYTYAWSNAATTASITAVAAGTYTVTVTDANGCTDTSTAVITEPTALTNTMTSVGVTCFGGSDGSALAAAGGGTSPYGYLWNTGATTDSISSLMAGTYTLTITDGNGCTLTDSVVIGTINQLPIVNLGDSNTICVGDTQLLDAGAGFTAYLWSNGALSQSVQVDSAGSYWVNVTDSNTCTNSDTFNLFHHPEIVIDVDSVDADCGAANGQATANVTVGGGGYAYLWSNSGTTATITGLSAGAYLVTVTDANGCSNVAAGLVNNVGAPSVTSTSTDVSCFGAMDGSASVTATGGSAPYTYLWSNGATTASISNLGPGTYTIDVTDSTGCIASDVVIITEPTAITAAIITIDANCGTNDGFITMTVTGGVPPYTYLWDDAMGQTTANADSLTAGIYNVTITDGSGCSVVETVGINNIGAASLSFGQVDVTCAGGSDGEATVTATGGIAPYTYAWDDPANQTTAIATGLGEGTFNVVVTDSAGCVSTGSVIIGHINELPIVDLGPDTTICNGLQLELDAGTGTAYIWSTGATTQNISVDSTATYSVTVTDGNGCDGVGSVTITVDGVCPGIGDLNKEVSVTYYPNPTDGILNMEIEGLQNEDLQITVFTVQGRVVLEEQVDQLTNIHFHQIDLGTQAQGIYFVRLSTENYSKVERISVQ